MKIKIGSTRICFMFSKVAVKIPIFFSWRRFIAGVASNYSEALTWEQTTLDLINGEENQQYLCEVYENLGGLLLIAERVHQLSDLEFLQIPLYVHDKLLRLASDKSEFVNQNVGRIEIDETTHYKLLDYGTNILIQSSKRNWIVRYLKILR